MFTIVKLADPHIKPVFKCVQHIFTFYSSLYIVLLLNLKQDFLWIFHGFLPLSVTAVTVNIRVDRAAMGLLPGSSSAMMYPLVWR